MNKTSYIYACLLLLLLGACSKSQTSQSGQQPSPVSKPLSMPAEKMRDNTDKGTDPNSKPEPAEKEAPCCKEDASKIYFSGLDVHGKLSGFDQGMQSMKEYHAKFVVEGDAAGLDSNQLLVVASMPGMKHDIEFPSEKVNDHEYKIDPVVFSMAGNWNVSWSVVDSNGEQVDSCVCKAQVK